MRLGYNTNGFAHHELSAALEVLAEIGYRSVAITLDHCSLNPFRSTWQEEAARVAEQLDRLQLASVVETGARYLLNPRVKHEPTLVSPDPAERGRRVAFLCRAIDVAQVLGSDCVSFWSGCVHDAAPQPQAWQRLLDAMQAIAGHAQQCGVRLGLEPEPGMLIDTMSKYEEFLDRFSGSPVHLTLDVGHLHCQGEVPIAGVIERWGPQIVNVHIEDMRVGVHEHLMFGEGEMEFLPILEALGKVGYQGGLHVELSRHSHAAPQAARQAYQFLAPLMPDATRL